MSASLARVKAALEQAGVQSPVLEMQESTRTAADAASAAGCEIDQIAKSILFLGETSGQLLLFITAGGRQVDTSQAAALAGEPLKRADAQTIRALSGFAIGGVAPIGHLSPPRVWLDKTLLQFQSVWAAAGTPRHIFEIPPQELLTISRAQSADFTNA